jgi:hypothetical protein
MPALTPMELTVLTAFLALLLTAVTAVLLLLRGLVNQVQDVATTYEILRKHPDLRDDLRWTPWTDSVDLAPVPRALPPISSGRF